MKLSQKRTCEGCRALDKSECALGFNNHGKQDQRLGFAVIAPQEPCYKPMTIGDFLAAGKRVGT